MTYGDIPENLYVAFLETVFFYSFGNYLFSRSSKLEFLAGYKNKKSSQSFRKFLHTLPEGIVIIDDTTSSFKFVNSKFKNTLAINDYIAAEENLHQINQMQQEINSEFDALIRDTNNEEFNHRPHSKAINDLMRHFRVMKNPEDYSQEDQLIEEH